MVTDDLEACLQAYQFAELCLRDFSTKPPRERSEALRMAFALRDEVSFRYERVLAAADEHRASRIAMLQATLARLQRQLESAERLADSSSER